MLVLDEMCGLSVEEVLSSGDLEAVAAGSGCAALTGVVSKKGLSQLEVEALQHEKEMLDKQLEEVSAEADRLQVRGHGHALALLMASIYPHCHMYSADSHSTSWLTPHQRHTLH